MTWLLLKCTMVVAWVIGLGYLLFDWWWIWKHGQHFR